MRRVPLKIIPDSALDDHILDTCASGLARSPDGSAPFALSYAFLVTSVGIIAEPEVRLWDMEDGAIMDTRLSSAPDKARDFAIQGFTFLGERRLREFAQKTLFEMIPFCRDAAYDFAITPHGAVLVSQEWARMHERYGEEAVAAAFIKEGLSAHAGIAAIHGLLDCVSATLGVRTVASDPSLPDEIIAIEQ